LWGITDWFVELSGTNYNSYEYYSCLTVFIDRETNHTHCVGIKNLQQGVIEMEKWRTDLIAELDNLDKLAERSMKAAADGDYEEMSKILDELMDDTRWVEIEKENE
jgi:hypothetical protein